jgi:hypothetical protein
MNGNNLIRYFQPDDIAKVGQPLVEIEIPEEENEKNTPETKTDTMKGSNSLMKMSF